MYDLFILRLFELFAYSYNCAPFIAILPPFSSILSRQKDLFQRSLQSISQFTSNYIQSDKTIYSTLYQALYQNICQYLSTSI